MRYGNFLDLTYTGLLKKNLTAQWYHEQCTILEDVTDMHMYGYQVYILFLAKVIIAPISTFCEPSHTGRKIVNNPFRLHTSCFASEHCKLKCLLSYLCRSNDATFDFVFTHKSQIFFYVAAFFILNYSFQI